MLAAAAAVAVVGLALSGCSGIQNLSQHLTGLTTKPKVGDCWTTTFSQSQKTEDWEGTAPLSCSQPHQTYTYAVTKLAKHFSYSSWLDSKGNIRTDVDEAAHDACVAEQKAILPAITVKEALLVPTYYVPSTALWSTGARWVRCDIGLIKVGSLVSSPVLAKLPAFADIRSTLESSPVTYALCEDDPASNGPDGAETTYASCSGAADLTFLATMTMAGADGAAYPGLAALTKIGQTQCATLTTPAGHVVVAEPPAKVDWTQYDDRDLDCWLNNN
jgi:Septum formation